MPLKYMDSLILIMQVTQTTSDLSQTETNSIIYSISGT